MYRSQIKSVIGRLSRAYRGAVQRQNVWSRSSFLLATPLLVPPAAAALLQANNDTTYCDDSESGNSGENAVPLAVLPASACEDVDTCEGDPSNESTILNNPLWPSGVSVDMVNSYVDQLLADPDINIKAIPDSMERTIYVSTVRLTLNTVYEFVSWLHGTEILAHRLVLDRSSISPEEVNALQLDLQHSIGKINVEVLEAMADELLKNKAINQRWLPDVIERQIYVNSLRIIFTIIDGIADTMAFHLAGHELSLRFEPVNLEVARKLIKRYHRDGIQIDEQAIDALCEQTMLESEAASPSNGVLSYFPGYYTFMRTLHVTLYSLILGIVDDILSKAELLILDDRITMSLVPASRFPNDEQKQETQAPPASEGES